jgi:hypothetical protein
MEHIFDKSKIIKNALKYKYQHPGNIVFWLENTDMDVRKKFIERFDYYRITKLHRKDRGEIH